MCVYITVCEFTFVCMPTKVRKGLAKLRFKTKQKKAQKPEEGALDALELEIYAIVSHVL